MRSPICHTAVGLLRRYIATHQCVLATQCRYQIVSPASTSTSTSARFTALNYGLGRSYLSTSTCGTGDSKEVVVFWDLDSCFVPEKVDPHLIGPNIVRVLRANSFQGPITIHAYGNTRSLNDQGLLQALITTGVDLHHIPSGVKDPSNHLILDLLLWVKKNPSPANVLLISGDKNFSSAVHKILMKGYNILWAHPEGDETPGLLAAASKVWIWDDVIRGIGLVQTIPKSNNCMEKKSVSHSLENSPQVQQEVEIQMERNKNEDLKKKAPGIPNRVVRKVVDIIRQRPEGFTLAAFRRQLARSNLVLDKDYYGHKNLLSFLLSIPKVKANLIWTTDNTRTYLFTEASPQDIDNKLEDRKSQKLESNLQTKQETTSDYKELEKQNDSLGKKISMAETDFNNPLKMSIEEQVDERKPAFRLLTMFRNLWKNLGFGVIQRDVSNPWKASVNGIMEKHNKRKEEKLSSRNQNLQNEFCNKTTQDVQSENKNSKGTKPIRSVLVIHDRQDESLTYSTFGCETGKHFQENMGTSNDNSFYTGFQEPNKSKSLEQHHVIERSEGEESLESGCGTKLTRSPFPKGDLKIKSQFPEGQENAVTECMSKGHSNIEGITREDLTVSPVESNITRFHKDEQLEKQSSYGTEVKTDNLITEHASGRTFQLEIRSDSNKGTSFEEHNNIQMQSLVDAEIDAGQADKSDRDEKCTVEKHLKDMLLECSQYHKDGLQLSHVKPEFRKRYGYDLNNKSLGHASLASLIRSIEGVVILEDKSHKIILSPSLAENRKHESQM